MEKSLKLIDKLKNDWYSCFIIEYHDGENKLTYDIRIKEDGFKLMLDGYGIKKARQREFRYPKIDKKFELIHYKKVLPAEVVNFAFEEYIKSITYDKFDVNEL